jgi:hypothetical protein
MASSDLTAAPPPSFKNPDSTPFIYFDIAPFFGIMAGAIQIELAARTLSPTQDERISTEFITTAHLRCSPAAARHLREAIDKSLEMLERPHEPLAASVGKLN